MSKSIRPNPPKRPNDRSPMSLTGSTDVCIVRVSGMVHTTYLPLYSKYARVLHNCHFTRLMHCNDVTASPFPHSPHSPHSPNIIFPTNQPSYLPTRPARSLTRSSYISRHHPSFLSLPHYYTPLHYYRERYTVIQMASYSPPP